MKSNKYLEHIELDWSVALVLIGAGQTICLASLFLSLVLNGKTQHSLDVLDHVLQKCGETSREKHRG